MREIIKRIAIAFTLMAVIALCQSAEAQTTTVTATVRDRTNALVTSGQVTFEEIPNALSTDGVSIFSANKVTCVINGSGLLKALDGVSACVITYNTLTTPAGTYYRVTFFPNFGRTAVMNFFAFQASQDLSTIVPTPGTMPLFSFVDLVTSQTISGNKTFSGTNTFSAVNTFSAIPVFTAGISGTAGQTLALPSAASSLVSRISTDIFTNKTFDTAGSGNIFKIAGALINSQTGAGTSVVLATSPTITTPIMTTPAITGGGTWASPTFSSPKVNTAPNAAWSIDAAQASQLITLANNATYDLAVGSGLVVIHRDDTGQAGLFLCAAGFANIINDRDGVYSGTSGTAGKTNFFHNGTTAYRIENKTGGSVNYYVTTIRTRSAT